MPVASLVAVWTSRFFATAVAEVMASAGAGVGFEGLEPLRDVFMGVYVGEGG